MQFLILSMIFLAIFLVSLKHRMSLGFILLMRTLMTSLGNH